MNWQSRLVFGLASAIAAGHRLRERWKSRRDVEAPPPAATLRSRLTALSWRRGDASRTLVRPTDGRAIDERPATGRVSPPWHVPVGRIVAVLLIVAVAGIVLYLADCIYEIPIDGGVAGDDPITGAILFKAADGSELATRGTIRGDKLDADALPKNLKQAIVAIEDRRFYEHGALDFHGMARAMFRDTFLGRAREGASTLTQQLARLMLLSPERTMKRKIQEALISFWLEHQLTKPEILARYLDTAYFGAGAYGADAAARRYFNKSVRDLTLPEAAMIAGLVRAPSQLAPHRNLEAAQARAKLVLKAMASTGAITEAQAQAAIAQPATLKISPETASGSGYAADAAAADVKGLVGESALDVTAITTIDPAIQAAAEKAVDDRLEAEGAAKHASQAALIAIGSDGAILAMVGGRDYDTSAFNRATQAKRQPGSLFKLFVYLSALEKGADVNSVVVDQPVTIGDWQPHNFEDTYRGRIPLHVAFAHSINTVAAELAQQVGIKTVIKTAHDLGVQSTLPDVPSLALGTAEVDLLEMTRAFATVASDQETISPYLVRRITSRDKVLFNRPPQYAGDADPSAPKLAMRDLLADVVREGTGKGAQLPFPTGGKTGTTQDFRDAWFIGSAPEITVGVWVGNDDDSPMKGVIGGDLPVKIWRQVVVEAEKSLGRRKEKQKPAARTAGIVPAPQADAARPGPTAPAPPGADRTAAAPARLDPMAALPTEAGPTATASGADIDGDAEVIDTSTLAVDGHEVRLQGITPMSGGPARALARHLRRREVSCTPTSGRLYRCSVDGDDLATTILANGGSSATPDAPADLVAAQDAAQNERRGIWRHRR